MKKALSIIACVLFTLAGLWIALEANVADDSPLDQGGLSILSAILFCIALLFAGYGNSIKWNGEKK